MRIKSLSYSSSSKYISCGFSYYLQYILGFEDSSGPSAILGNIIHTILEILTKATKNKHPENSKIWDISYLTKITFNHYCNKEPDITSQIGNDKLKKVAIGLTQLINGPNSPTKGNILGAEIGFRLTLEEKEFLTDENIALKINGFIDKVTRIDEKTIEIIDYKTGKREIFGSKVREKINPGILYDELQPRIYHLAAKKIFGDIAENILVTFIYITDGGPVTVPFCDEDIKVTKEMIRKRFIAIKNDNDPHRERGWKCRFCIHDKTGNCDKVWQEKNDLGMKFIENKYTVLNYKKK